MGFITSTQSRPLKSTQIRLHNKQPASSYCTMRVSGEGLEPNAIAHLPDKLNGDVTSKLARPGRLGTKLTRNLAPTAFHFFIC